MNFWYFSASDIITIILAVVIVPISVFGGYYVGRWLRTPVQRIEEDNLRSTNNTLFECVNIFDDYFNYFYREFEIQFRDFKGLSQNFLPKTTSITVFAGEVVPLENQLTEEERAKNLKIMQKFAEFKRNVINETIISLEDAKKNLAEIIQEKDAIVYGHLKNNINWYMSGTLSYLSRFKGGHHYASQLGHRRENAERIIQIIKDKKIKQDDPVKIFITKWNEYNYPDL